MSDFIGQCLGIMSRKIEPKLADLIRDFDRKVRDGALDQSYVVLSKLFAVIEGGKEGFGNQLITMSEASERDATLLASAITNLITSPNFKLGRRLLNLMAQHKRVISQTFEISGYRGTAHLAQMLGSKSEGGGIRLKGTQVLALFCGISLNAMSVPVFELLMQQKKEISWPLMMSFLTEQLLWNEQAEEVRSRILASAERWKDMPISPAFVRNLGPAYMGCSYAHAPHKHDIKRAMNHMARRWLQDKGIEDIEPLSTGKRGVKRKPTLVIIAELYNSTHAMHRCYGPAIRALKGRFKLIYMPGDGKCDDGIRSMFDKVDDIGFNFDDPKAFFDKVKSYRPDVVYYPSVGMRMVSILGSNLRLAPMQVLTFGHPATTNSDFMDYAILVDGQLNDETTVNEKILYRPSTPRWERRPDAKNILPNIRLKPTTFRIAVPAWSRKVTPSFLAACKRVQDKAKRPIEFVFFPNGVGSLFQAFKRRVETMLNAKVLPRTSYNTYVDNLNRCDIFLSTFPFGATNGIIDAALQGLPIVNVQGEEVHGGNDADMVAKFEQPSWLTTKNEEEFIAATLKLVHDDELRVQISRDIAAFDHATGLLVEAKECCEEFGVVMEAAYRNHEELMQSSQHAFKYETLSKLIDA
jgi:hypothetical protein